MIEQVDVLIVGAGASGLMAGKILAESGLKVVVLEAKSRAGGRIYTLPTITGKSVLEAGAEFIHGDLPATLDLLGEAQIPYYQTKGKSWHFKNGEFKKEESLMDDWPVFMEKLKELQEDLTMENFLATYFHGDEYKELRTSVRNFLEGYDAATADKASAIALRDEWMNEEDTRQYRIEGGYGRLVDYLQHAVREKDGAIVFEAAVKSIRWGQNKVEAILENNQVYRAKRAIITVPLGVLIATPPSKGAIEFIPPLPEKMAAAGKMGFGAVIKILLQFSAEFWKMEWPEKDKNCKFDTLAFLFSDAEIPTWWTQFPLEEPMLTGWLAGPKAELHKNTKEEEMLDLSLASLSYIFKIDVKKLKENLVSSQVYNWTADPFINGAYSYASIKHTLSMEILKKPEKDSLYFAGEALYEGAEIGTVEAALVSGRDIARTVLHHLK